MVDSENTVLAVANLWMTRGQGQSTTEQEVGCYGQVTYIHSHFFNFKVCRLVISF